MVLKESFYNLQCDHCGCMADDDLWHPDLESACESADGWLIMNNKHYCPNCWQYDDEDNILIADGTKLEFI